jgi:AcrR family transcriptional regulator
MTRKRDTEVRQDQIAQAALALIARHGLRRLSVAAVARRVGLVPSAIYRHFDGKEAVIDTVLDLVRERLFDNVRAVREESSLAIDRLRLLLFRHMALVRDNQGLPRVVFSEEVYTGRPDRKSRMFATIQAYLDQVGAIVSEGQRDGAIRPDLDPATVSVMFLGLIQPAAILWHMSGGTFDVTRHTADAWRVFRRAIEAG